MAQGMKLPVQVNKKGGARLVDASVYAKQTVSAALTPNVSMNPFQSGNGVELGISERFIFAINSPGTQANCRRQIVKAFSRLREKDIAKLAAGRDGIKFTAINEELIAEINYIELEADQEKHLSTNFKDALQSAPKVNYGNE